MSHINPKLIFPTILIALNLCGSVVNFSQGDWRRGLYWLFAAGLNIVITF